MKRKRNKLQKPIGITFQSEIEYRIFDQYCIDHLLVKSQFVKAAIFEKIERDT